MNNLKTPSLLNFSLKHLKPLKLYISAILLIIAYQSFFWVYNPYILKQVIDILSDPNTVRSDIWQQLHTPIIIYLLTWFVAIVGYRLKEMLERYIYPDYKQMLLQSMFSHAISHTTQFYQNTASGKVSNRILEMSNGLLEILSISFELIFNLALIAISISFLYLVHPSIITILIIWLLVFTLTTAYFSSKVLEHSHAFSEEKTNLVGYLVDTISNVSIIRAFSQHSYEKQRFKAVTENTTIFDRKLRASILTMRVFWEFSIFSALCIFMITLVNLYQANLATVGDFSFVTSTFIGVIHNIWHLMNQYVKYSEQIGKCRQSIGVMVPTAIQDKISSQAVESITGSISFEKVNFSHLDSPPLFSNKSLHIPAKQKVGLVGLSGSGKTTFINLLLRFYDIHSGMIKLDDHSIDEIKLSSLRKMISLIPQDPSLLNRSVLDNIRYGSEDAPDTEVIQAAKLAHCHEFIEQLPDQYDTIVGEKGAKLSGGQRQRIAIARAFLRQSPILILDEATSALDSVTEGLIQDSLHSLFEEKTTLIIAHRLSTLSMMDRILVFDGGQIIEDGTHLELISHGGQYSKMWAMQSGGFIFDDTD
ncbi:ABC transporter ATP-binding protein/permease [Gammaproteobacteria bacterium]|nr:ABC transporter ATP-binding protein/permease [Gammaproteobacteria bacterium]